jgi:hypothetical protein
MDWIAYLRRMAVIIDTDATPSQVGPTSAELRDLADEIERMQKEAADE